MEGKYFLKFDLNYVFFFFQCKTPDESKTLATFYVRFSRLPRIAFSVFSKLNNSLKQVFMNIYFISQNYS